MTKINIKQLDIHFKGISREILNIINEKLRFDLINYSRSLHNSITPNLPAKIDSINAGTIYIDDKITPSEISEKIASKVVYSIQVAQTGTLKEEI